MLGGCGGGGSSGSSSKTAGGSADSPKVAVQAFIDATGKADWKTVCSRLANEGQAELGTELAVAQHARVLSSEQDSFGQWKSCESTLQKRAAATRAIFSGAGPAGAEQGRSAKRATVTSPQGNWTTTIESPSKQWRVASFPQPK
jgi:hypothetical protein